MPKTNIVSTRGHLYVTIMAVTKALVVQMILNALPFKKTLEEKRFSEKFPTFVSGLRQLSPYISE